MNDQQHQLYIIASTLHFHRFALIAVVLTSIGCSDTSLSGSSGKNRASTPPPKEAEPANKPDEMNEPTAKKANIEPQEIVAESTEIVEQGGQAELALQNCLDQWPDHPFSNSQITNAEEILVDQSNNNNRISFQDDKQSSAPRLVLITVTSKNVNSGEITLQDPKGWYCVDIQSKAANNFSISSACSSVVATLTHSEHVANGFQIKRPPNC